MGRRPNHRLQQVKARGKITASCICGAMHGRVASDAHAVVVQKQHRLDSGARW